MRYAAVDDRTLTRRCGSGYILPDQLSDILKANYRPSEVETNQVTQRTGREQQLRYVQVHSWLDRSSDGKVYFEDYVVVMASVMEKAGINQEQGASRAAAAVCVVTW